MSQELLKVAERAKRDPDTRFNSLAHLLDQVALERAYHRIRKNAALGVDGITKEHYGQRLEENLRGLHEQDFLECSCGFRPNRSAHDALRATYEMVTRERTAVILEADIQAFLETPSHYPPSE